MGWIDIRALSAIARKVKDKVEKILFILSQSLKQFTWALSCITHFCQNTDTAEYSKKQLLTIVILLGIDTVHAH